jgi:peptidoglycan/xylan/chitin deacetylase (PgdA/CDA1 family)
VRGSFLKRLLVVSVSLTVFIFDAACEIYLRLVGRRAKGKAVALLYHSIPVADRARFGRQMDTLRRLAVPVRADVRAPLAPCQRHVAVTFDDGLWSFVESAWPELQKRHIPATIFVVVGKLGTIPSWTNYSPGLMPTEPMLSLDQLRQLPDSVLVGSHSLTHRLLTEVSEETSRDEIGESRHRLEMLLERRIRLFSFPYGEQSGDLIQRCRDAGYERVFTSQPCAAFLQPDEFVTGRIDVQPTDWQIEFRLKVLGAYRWLPHAFAVKRALLNGFTDIERREAERL